MWTFYFFNIWVSLFSIMLVSQGWRSPAMSLRRGSKALLRHFGRRFSDWSGLGGTFAAWLVRIISVRYLLCPCAGMVMIAYGLFRLMLTPAGGQSRHAKGAEDEEPSSR